LYGPVPFIFCLRNDAPLAASRWLMMAPDWLADRQAAFSGANGIGVWMRTV
jgi:hypothetical protein